MTHLTFHAIDSLKRAQRQLKGLQSYERKIIEERQEKRTLQGNND